MRSVALLPEICPERLEEIAEDFAKVFVDICEKRNKLAKTIYLFGNLGPITMLQVKEALSGYLPGREIKIGLPLKIELSKGYFINVEYFRGVQLRGDKYVSGKWVEGCCDHLRLN